MNSLLEALQVGRLIELPEDRSKERALTILANLIEAVPTVPTGTDLTAAVIAREQTGSTALGNAWACPHARFGFEGDLVCAVGWSPVGIDYGAPDGRPVRIVVMYLVPANQKNAYLKEVSSLAKALAAQTAGSAWDAVRGLNEARTVLLDMVSAVLESAAPDARARMIRLEARQAVAAAPAAGTTLAGLTVQTLTIVAGAGLRPVVLAQHRELVDLIEKLPDLAATLGRQGFVEAQGWRIVTRGATNYQAERVVFDCLAIRAGT